MLNLGYFGFRTEKEIFQVDTSVAAWWNPQAFWFIEESSMSSQHSYKTFGV